MRRVRARVREPTCEDYLASEYLPVNFEAMIEHLHHKNRRLDIEKQISWNHRELLDRIEAGQSL